MKKIKTLLSEYYKNNFEDITSDLLIEEFIESYYFDFLGLEEDITNKEENEEDLKKLYTYFEETIKSIIYKCINERVIKDKEVIKK